MKIKINGEEKLLECEAISLKELLEKFNIEQKYNVIAVNYECIKKSQYSEIEIRESDEIEILSPMQGG